MVVLAFFGWVAGGFRFVYRAWDEDGEFHSGPALTWAGVITAFMALWIVAMTLA